MDPDPIRSKVTAELQTKTPAVLAAVLDMLAVTCACSGKFFVRTSRPISEGRRRRTWFCPRCRKTKIEIVSAGVDRTTKSVPKLLDSRGEILPSTSSTSTTTSTSTAAASQPTTQAGRVSFAMLAERRRQERESGR